MPTLELEREPAAAKVRVTASHLVVDLDDGRTLSVPLEWFPRLVHGTKAERQNWQLMARGYGIEWPDLDEHISVEGLLAGIGSRENKKSIQRWLASRGKSGT